MKLRILGCAGAESPGHKTSSYLIDDILLVDAGVICSVLSDQEQAAIRHILITHTHIDHIKGIPSLADNHCINRVPGSVELVGSTESIEALRHHLFNGLLWPDFTRIPSAEEPALTYREVTPDVEHRIGCHQVTPYRVNHTVPAVGYRVSSGNKTLLFSGDTGPTERLWEVMDRVDALIVEVSFPNDMERLARESRHLTARMLTTELAKARSLPPRILITHPKPQYFDVIRTEVEALGIAGSAMLHDGDIFEF